MATGTNTRPCPGGDHGRGRHQGRCPPGTGRGLPRSFAYEQIHIVRIVDGKGTEHWAVRDDASLMRRLTSGQLAGAEAPAPR
ncbi:ester cyclase [Pseudonocardia hierapolitana]|uniref:ester cyclase n=1 Tax=Pseudonocardia hierapolitana TaxID=1128676 RepID=UPI003CCC8AB9